MGQRDLARLVPPRGPEPRRCIQTRPVEIRKRRDAAIGHAAKHRVDQPGERRQPSGARQANRRRHGCVAWRIQQQQSGRAETQHMAHWFGRHLAEERLQHCIQRAHPPQHRRGEAMRGRTVARGCDRERIQGLFERPAPIQHRGQQVERSLPRRIGHQREMERQTSWRPCSRQRASTSSFCEYTVPVQPWLTRCSTT